jgi:NAD(P)-dependent dehydrogenase (short-subunit alcohol dehydrogenase family)
MLIDGSVALVTGANRDLGQVFARMLVSRGCGQGLRNGPPIQEFWDAAVKGTP